MSGNFGQPCKGCYAENAGLSKFALGLSVDMVVVLLVLGQQEVGSYRLILSYELGVKSISGRLWLRLPVQC